MHDASRLLSSLAALAVTVSLADAQCPEAPDLTIRWIEGDDAPGTPDAFQAFDRPSLNRFGALAFGGDTDGVSSADDVVYANGALVAREGQAVPGLSAAVFDQFEFFETTRQINADGDVAFVATLRDDPLGRDRAVCRGASLVALENDSAPTLDERVYTDFGYVGLTDDDRVGFVATLDGASTDNSAIILGDTVLYRKGAIVPGSIDVVWDGAFDEVQWNGRGDVLFEGNTSLPTPIDHVLFRRRQLKTGPLVEEIVAQEGQAIATDKGPDTLAIILQSALAEDGSWALRGNLSDAPASDDSIIMTEHGFFAQEGNAVSELPGVVLGNFNAVAINSLHDVAVLADLDGATGPDVDEGIFVNGCLLVTDGMPVPGMPDGTIFTDLGFEDVVINDVRQIAFAASYQGPTNGDGLFIIDLGAPCVGDVDGSGSVDGGDLVTILTSWGPCASCPADLDGSGVVDFADLLMTLTAWGVCSTP